MKREKGQGVVEFSLILLMLALAVLLAMMLIPGANRMWSEIVQQVDVSESHGPARHGAITATRIRTCLENQGPSLEWLNPANNRKARVCEVEPGRFGIQILRPAPNGTWKEVTIFQKEKFTRIEQVINYLKNVGYGPTQ